MNQGAKHVFDRNSCERDEPNHDDCDDDRANNLPGCWDGWCDHAARVGGFGRRPGPVCRSGVEVVPARSARGLLGSRLEHGSAWTRRRLGGPRLGDGAVYARRSTVRGAHRRGRGPSDRTPRVHAHPGSSPAPRDHRRACTRGVRCRPLTDLDRAPRGSPGPSERPSGTHLGANSDPLHRHGTRRSLYPGICARHQADGGLVTAARGTHACRAGPSAQRERTASPGTHPRAAHHAWIRAGLPGLG